MSQPPTTTPVTPLPGTQSLPISIQGEGTNAQGRVACVDIKYQGEGTNAQGRADVVAVYYQGEGTNAQGRILVWSKNP